MGAAVRDLDLGVVLAGSECRVQSGALPVGEVLLPRPEGVPDAVQRVALAAAVAGGVLSDATADVVDDGGCEVRSARGAVTVLPTVPFPRAASRTGRAACTAPGSPRARAEVEPLGDVGEGGPAGGDDAAVSVAGDRHRCRVKQCRLPVAWPPAGGPVSSPEGLPPRLAMFVPQPSDDPVPRVVAQVSESGLGHRVTEVGRPAPQHRIELAQQVA